MGNTNPITGSKAILPTGVDLSMICRHNCLICSVEKQRVIATTLCGFYRYSNLGGYGYSQEPTHLCVSDYPLDFKKELL